MNNRKFKSIIINGLVIAICIIHAPAWADWAEVGASTRCTKREFSLNGFIESNGGNIPAPKDTKALKHGNSRLLCRINGSKIDATVWLSGPRENGECGSGGRIEIMRLRIDEQDVIKSGERMLLYCSSEPSILSVNITAKQSSGLTLKICKGTWEWGDTYEGVECTEKFLSRPTTKFR